MSTENMAPREPYRRHWASFATGRGRGMGGICLDICDAA